jgi:hypothetical protein
MAMVSNSMEIWRIDSQISGNSWEADAGRIDTSAPRGDHRQRTAGNLRSADESLKCGRGAVCTSDIIVKSVKIWYKFL